MRMRTLPTFVALAFLTAAVLSTGACSKPTGTAQETVIETPDGAIIVDTFTATATVTGIDADKRELVLVTPEGRKTTYKAGPDVVNFSQIQVGDQVKAVLTEEVAVSIDTGASPGGAAAGAVALAPEGAKPGGIMVATTRVTAKVTAVDAKKHKVTFQFADGTTKTVKAGKKVDLSSVQLGTDVTIQVGEGVALSVTKP